MAADCVQRFTFENADIRGFIVRLDQSLASIIEQQNYPEPIVRLLGEVLMASVLIFSTLSFKGRLIIQLRNQGPIKLLVAKCNHELHISGLAQWDESSAIHSIKKTLDHGELVVTLLRDNNVKPYQSIIGLKEQNISSSLEDYFSQSEQLPTKFWIDSNNGQGVGLMLQLLPQKSASSIQDFYLETAKLSNQDICQHLHTLDNPQLLQKLFPNHDLRLFDGQPVSFRCECSMERMENAIKVLGKKDALDIIKTDKHVKVTCEFCGQQYSFDEQMILALFADRPGDNDG